MRIKKSPEERFDLYDTPEECADKAAPIFAFQKWKWFMVGIPNRKEILETLIELRDYVARSDASPPQAETGRLIYYDGRYGHEKETK